MIFSYVLDWFSIFRIVITLLSLIGVWLNIKKKSVCFIIWMFTNAAWTVVDFYFGVYEQSILFFVYFILAIYGVVEWKVKPALRLKKEMKKG